MQDEDRMPEAEKEPLAQEVMEDLGEPKPSEAAEEINEPISAERNQGFDDPLYVQKRLKRQERAHAKELRGMRDQIRQLSERLQQPRDAYDQPERGADQYAAGGEDTIAAGDMNQVISRAVSQALRAKEDEERRAKDAQALEHVQRQYDSLNDHLDSLSDKYDDFDDVVRGERVPFTSSMREASLVLPTSGRGSAGEVLYKLGKNRSELERISKLHPLDQAKEMIKLSMALMGGQNGDESNRSPQRTLSQIKSNPSAYSSQDITERTPISELRQRMKAGWKRR